MPIKFGYSGELLNWAKTVKLTSVAINQYVDLRGRMKSHGVANLLPADHAPPPHARKIDVHCRGRNPIDLDLNYVAVKMPRSSERSPPCCVRAGKSRSRTAGAWCRRRLEAWNAHAGHARAQTSLPAPGRTPHARWRRRRARGQGRPFGAAEPESQHADADVELAGGGDRGPCPAGLRPRAP